MRFARFALVTALLIPGPIARAQTTIPPNAKVRVSLRDGTKVSGRLAEVRGDTITVLKSNGLLIGVPGDLTRSVAVSRGKRPSVGRVIVGALSGVTASLLATAVIPGLTVTKCSADVCSTSPAFEEALFIGLVGGSLVGAMLTTDRWETVARPVRVGFAGGVRKARVGVALTF